MEKYGGLLWWIKLDQGSWARIFSWGKDGTRMVHPFLGTIATSFNRITDCNTLRKGVDMIQFLRSQTEWATVGVTETKRMLMSWYLIPQDTCRGLATLWARKRIVWTPSMFNSFYLCHTSNHMEFVLFNLNILCLCLIFLALSCKLPMQYPAALGRDEQRGKQLNTEN